MSYCGLLQDQTFVSVLQHLMYQSGLLLLKQTNGHTVEIELASGFVRKFRVNGMPFFSPIVVSDWLSTLAEDQSSAFSFEARPNASAAQLLCLGQWLADQGALEAAGEKPACACTSGLLNYLKQDKRLFHVSNTQVTLLRRTASPATSMA